MNLIRMKYELNCPRTVTVYFWHWLASFHLELAGTKCINRKLETIEKFWVIQKTAQNLF